MQPAALFREVLRIVNPDSPTEFENRSNSLCSFVIVLHSERHFDSCTDFNVHLMVKWTGGTVRASNPWLPISVGLHELLLRALRPRIEPQKLICETSWVYCRSSGNNFSLQNKRPGHHSVLEKLILLVATTN